MKCTKEELLETVSIATKETGHSLEVVSDANHYELYCDDVPVLITRSALEMFRALQGIMIMNKIEKGY